MNIKKISNMTGIVLIIIILLPYSHADIQDITPIGTVTSFSGSSAPDGWLFTDGSVISKSIYSELCDILGSTYGINNATHCQLPDTTDVFIRGTGTLGQTGGQINHTFETDPPAGISSNNGSHLHFTDIPSFTSGASGSISVGIVGLLSTASPPNHIHTVNPPNTASTTNGAHLHTVDLDPFNTTISNVLPPYLSLNYIIKALSDELEDPVDLECSAFNSPGNAVGCAATSRFFNGTARSDIMFNYVVRDSTGAVFDSGSTTKIAELNTFSFTTDSTPDFYYTTIYNNTFGWNDTKVIQTQFIGLTAEQNETLYNLTTQINNINMTVNNLNVTAVVNTTEIAQASGDYICAITRGSLCSQNFVDLVDGRLQLRGVLTSNR